MTHAPVRIMGSILLCTGPSVRSKDYRIGNRTTIGSTVLKLGRDVVYEHEKIPHHFI